MAKRVLYNTGVRNEWKKLNAEELLDIIRTNIVLMDSEGIRVWIQDNFQKVSERDGEADDNEDE